MSDNELCLPEPNAQEALQVTTATYDATAAQFAERTMNIDMGEAMRWFAARIPASARVLDAGCGPGRDVAALRLMGHDAIGMDLSMGMLKQVAQHAPDGLVNGDLAALPFGAASFQGIWACASLLHLPRPAMERSLAELCRVLITDGVLYVAVKRGSGGGYVASPDGRQRYFAFYALPELRQLVESQGFVVIEARERQDPNRPDTTWIHLLATPGSA